MLRLLPETRSVLRKTKAFQATLPKQPQVVPHVMLRGKIQGPERLIAWGIPAGLGMVALPLYAFGPIALPPGTKPFLGYGATPQ